MGLVNFKELRKVYCVNYGKLCIVVEVTDHVRSFLDLGKGV